MFKNDVELINDFIENALPKKDEDYGVIFDSVKYSAENGGKRIRPYIALLFCRMCGGRDEDALVLGTALEFIHTYSLIHDDLPCMDDDDLRRGKPTNHKVFGEATATLAGDALLTYAFEYVIKSNLSDSAKLKAINILASNAGIYGMIGGQVLDMMGEEKPLDKEMHLKMNSLKTGCLIKSAALLGLVAAENTANVKAELWESAKIYAENIGLSFQITDDLLDVFGDEEIFGKPIGSDADNGKTTFLSVLGIDGARKESKRLTEEAKSEIMKYDGSKSLVELADMLYSRNK